MQFRPFNKLIKYLALKTELMQVFHKYCPHFNTKTKHYPKVIYMIKVFEKPIMSPEQFFLFKRKEHTEEISVEKAEHIILSSSEGSETTGRHKEKSNCISFVSICKYVFSACNIIMDPRKRVVY